MVLSFWSLRRSLLLRSLYFAMSQYSSKGSSKGSIFWQRATTDPHLQSTNLSPKLLNFQAWKFARPSLKFKTTRDDAFPQVGVDPATKYSWAP